MLIFFNMSMCVQTLKQAVKYWNNNHGVSGHSAKNIVYENK